MREPFTRGRSSHRQIVLSGQISEYSVASVQKSLAVGLRQLQRRVYTELLTARAGHEGPNGKRNASLGGGGCVSFCSCKVAYKESNNVN